jgi:hypothetical protein
VKSTVIMNKKGNKTEQHTYSTKHIFLVWPGEGWRWILGGVMPSLFADGSHWEVRTIKPRRNASREGRDSPGRIDGASERWHRSRCAGARGGSRLVGG